MKQLAAIAAEAQTTQGIIELTSAFESLASMRIARNKSSVLQARQFFQDIYAIYSRIRVDEKFSYGRDLLDNHKRKDLCIAITADAGLSGDINKRVIDLLLSTYSAEQQDIIVIGKQGALQLAERGVDFVRHFKLPVGNAFHVEPIVEEVKKYASTKIFYESYESLASQTARVIDIKKAVESYGKEKRQAKKAVHDDSISDKAVIFEPTVRSVIAFFEKTMIQLTLTETIVESRLAQDASRFTAMQQANDHANDMLLDVRSEYNKTKRYLSDERLREVIRGLKSMQQEGAL